MGGFEKFKSEVLSFGADACLPKNLPNYWFTYVSSNLDDVLQNGKEVSPKTMTLMLEILKAKTDVTETSHSFDKMFEYFQQLRFEFAIEILNQSGLAKIESATLATIFTNRTIGVNDIKMSH